MLDNLHTCGKRHFAVAQRNIKRINPGVDDADNYVHDLKILVEKKLQMFPKVKKLIVDAVVEPISETQYRVTVVSTDNAEQLKQMLTKVPIWLE